MIIGVDTHKRNHTFVSVDGNGRQLKVLTGSTTTEANLAALRWAIAQSRRSALGGRGQPVDVATVGT